MPHEIIHELQREQEEVQPDDAIIEESHQYILSCPRSGRGDSLAMRGTENIIQADKGEMCKSALVTREKEATAAHRICTEYTL